MSTSQRIEPRPITVCCAWCKPVDNASPEAVDEATEVGNTICPQCQLRYFEFASEELPAKQDSGDTSPVSCVALGSGVRLLIRSRWASTYPALRAIIILTLAGLWAGCGARQPQDLARTTMPNPDGCFVRVWNERGFAGASDFINGPVQYQHLRDLPNRRSWKNRIGSLTLGPGASVVAWSEEGFEGLRVPLTIDSKERGKFAVLPVKIQSLDIRCATQFATSGSPALVPTAPSVSTRADVSN